MRKPPPFLSAASLILCLSAAISRTPAEVRVTGERLEVNGIRELPVGMFGVHATQLTPERIEAWGIESIRDVIFVPRPQPRTPGNGFPASIGHYIECFWDRFHPALQLMNPNGWRQHLETLGREYGEAARNTHFQHRVEFWNEAYLNWASRPGVNYDPQFFEQQGIQEGDRVYIRGQDTPTEHLIWRPGHFLAQYPSGNPVGIMGYVRGSHFQRDPFSPLMRGANFNERIEFQGQTFQIRQQLVPFDPTQFERADAGNRWWSGQQNRIWYEEMFLVFGEALKAANPDVHLAMGWGFHFNQGGWAAWRELYRPVLEAGIHLVDAVHEHHYGGDTRMVAANYEVVWNWALARHGKKLEMWNTEAGGQLDPERPDVVAARPEGTRMEQARGAATYTLRDILYLMLWSPDKATARAAHEAHLNGGDEFAFRLLRDLRGQLLTTRASRRDIWPVATLTTDEALVLAIFNDQNRAVTLPVEIDIPAPYTLAGPGALRRIVEDTAAQRLAIDETVLPARPGSTFWEGEVEIGPKTAVSIRLPLQGAAGAADDVSGPLRKVTQVPMYEKLLTIQAETPFESRIALPEALLASPAAARIRFAMINYRGQGHLEINGHRVAIEPGNWMHSQEIDPAWLQAENVLRFVAGGQSYGIWTASIEVDQLLTP